MSSTKFKGRSTDSLWGPFDYSVTSTQWDSAQALSGLFVRLSRRSYFCSQNPKDGTITMGVDNVSVDIRRDGRVYPNSSTR